MNLAILKFLLRSNRKEITMIKSEIQAIADGIVVVTKQRDAALSANAPLKAQIVDLTQRLASSQQALSLAQSQIASNQQDDADGLEALHAALSAAIDPVVEETPVEDPAPVTQDAPVVAEAAEPQTEVEQPAQPTTEAVQAVVAAEEDQAQPLAPSSTGNAFLDAMQGTGIG